MKNFILGTATLLLQVYIPLMAQLPEGEEMVNNHPSKIESPALGISQLTAGGTSTIRSGGYRESITNLNVSNITIEVHGQEYVAINGLKELSNFSYCRGQKHKKK